MNNTFCNRTAAVKAELIKLGLPEAGVQRLGYATTCLISGTMSQARALDLIKLVAAAYDEGKGDRA